MSTPFMYIALPSRFVGPDPCIGQLRQLSVVGLEMAVENAFVTGLMLRTESKYFVTTPRYPPLLTFRIALKLLANLLKFLLYGLNRETDLPE